MSTTLNDEHWLNLITQCRSSGLTDRQWCIKNGIVRGKVILQPQGKEFFTSYGKEFFT